jgi:fructan beta-fructosidase
MTTDSHPQIRSELYRPQFHFTPARNWVNDPNGLVWYDGEFHLFYQYNPYGDQWGHMSWGHAVSADLVNWQELPVAIAEDERVSIFSGSVVVDTHDSSGLGHGGAAPLVALYTGCLRRPEGGQAQELAWSNDRGRTWTQYAGNPVLDLGLRDFRDPKVFWHAPSARWVVVVMVPDDRRAQFYGSPDLKGWSLLSEFASPFVGEGIWECPDLISLPVPGEASTWLFKVDVLGGHPSGGSGARIFFGHFDGTRFIAEPEDAPRWADHGADFYAALSWSNLPATPDATQHQVWLAWMSCHRYAKHLPTHPWRGAMSVPRALSVRRVEGALQLLQQPVAALARQRRRSFRHEAINVADSPVALLPADADVRAIEVELVITATSAQECGLMLRASGDEVTVVGCSPACGTVFVDRSRAGFNPPDDAMYAQRREAPYPAPSPGRPWRLRVLVDWSSVEVFVGDGELTLTEQIFPRDDSRGAWLYSSGGETQFGFAQVWELAAAAIV